ncbi:MAG: hypothetical protein P8N75_11080 [Ascidiaceihabitans sp.]|nr:hypothetical protein [Ascidiaceihabitans sp.]
MSDSDVNRESVLTIDEVKAVCDDVLIDGFSAIDLNSDGVLYAERVQAAQDAGIMPES